MISVIAELFIGIIMASNDCERFGYQIFKDYFGYQIFKDYEDGKFIFKHEQNNLIHFLCGVINSYWSPNRWYFQEWYNESSNLWRERQSLALKGKYGERICYNRTPEGELIDLTDAYYKEHYKICYRCSSLKAVKF